MKNSNDRPLAVTAGAIGAASLALGALFVSVASIRPANAVPSFALQTGQQCVSCHVGGFGPQLTPFGRDFKLRGYTARAVGQFETMPFSAMAVASYLRTSRDQAAPPAPHYSVNDNTAFDQGSLFFATGMGEHFGAFVQGTYDGIGHVWKWDNLDLRAVTTATIAGSDTLLGLSLNNSPGTQETWNTLPAWGYPYTASGLAPAPAAGTLMSGALAQNVLGVSGYALWNSEIYTELGVYWSPSASFIHSLGVNPATTSEIDGAAPYARIAYQKNFGDRNFEVGAFGFFSDLFPGRDRSAGTVDRYRDLGLDASYQFTTQGGDTLALNARYTNEHQDLAASQALLLAANSSNTLNDLRIDASYYRRRFGATIAAFNTWGSADALLYAGGRTNSPNSSGLMLELNHTPWGEGGSPFGARFNARIGVQYVNYFEFDGARHNYDGLGRDASDNNTLRIYTWFAY